VGTFSALSVTRSFCADDDIERELVRASDNIRRCLQWLPIGVDAAIAS
jgi:hypothetical protein